MQETSICTKIMSQPYTILARTVLTNMARQRNIFYIFLTVHLGTILVNNQLDALFQCIYLFHFSTCFEQPSAHHQEN